MKKHFIIVLMLMYGLSSSGMSIKLHYCCGKLDGISLIENQANACKMGNHHQRAGCCADKQISASPRSDQQVTTKVSQVVKKQVSVPAHQSANTPFKGTLVSVNLLARGTPVAFFHSLPLFIRHCVFRL